MREPRLLCTQQALRGARRSQVADHCSGAYSLALAQHSSPRGAAGTRTPVPLSVPSCVQLRPRPRAPRLAAGRKPAIGPARRGRGSRLAVTRGPAEAPPRPPRPVPAGHWAA
ncbi:hypothetical protein ACRRTK_013196 [Alexandromys fortis]